MIKKFTISNRPISPHLLVYSPQESSLFSIWHRITGIILIILVTFFLFIFKFFSIYHFLYFYHFFNSFLFFNSLLWFTNFTYLFSFLTFLYHALNGIRHIIWDTGFLLNLKYLLISSLLVVLAIFSILIFNILNF